jgi:hypothetical protein
MTHKPCGLQTETSYTGDGAIDLRGRHYVFKTRKDEQAISIQDFEKKCDADRISFTNVF